MTVFFGSQVLEKDRQKNIRNFCEEGSSDSNETVNLSWKPTIKFQFLPNFDD